MESGVFARSFVKAALFIQVLKTSVALSIIKDAPKDLNVEFFVNKLRKAHESYENYKENSYYQSNRIRILSSKSFDDANTLINLSENETLECVTDNLIQICKYIESSRMGFHGLLDVEGSLSEVLLLPTIEYIFQSLACINQLRSTIEDTHFLQKVALLFNEATSTLVLAGELAAKLDLNEQSTIEIANLLAAILDLICSAKVSELYYAWLNPIKSLLSSYTRSVHKCEDLHVPHLANFICKHLLNLCLKYLVSNTDESNTPNEIIPRIYVLLFPLLKTYKRKLEMGKDLAEFIRQSSEKMQSMDFIKNHDLALNNGSIGLLNVLKNKLQELKELPN